LSESSPFYFHIAGRYNDWLFFKDSTLLLRRLDAGFFGGVVTA
jgi:hypothetical protein